MDMGFCIDSKMSEDLRQKSIYSLVHNLYTGRVTDIDVRYYYQKISMRG